MFYARKYKAITSNYSVDKNVNVKTDDYRYLSIKNVKPSDSFLDMKSIISTNNKIADVYGEISNSGIGMRFYVSGHKEGKCKIIITDFSGKKHITNVIVKDPKPYLKYNDITDHRGGKTKNKLMYAKGKVKWASSNPRIATVSKNGLITGKNGGNCIISARCRGKIYKCKVKIYYRNPDFYSELTKYNTRDNYFEVSIKNHSKQSITIYSSGAYSQDDDYKIYDRKLRLIKNKKKIVIKPKKNAKIRFKIIGKNTWPDVSIILCFISLNLMESIIKHVYGMMIVEAIKRENIGITQNNNGQVKRKFKCHRY